MYISVNIQGFNYFLKEGSPGDYWWEGLINNSTNFSQDKIDHLLSILDIPWETKVINKNTNPHTNEQ